MIVSLAQLNASVDRNRIYFVLLDQQLSLRADDAGSLWNSTQIGIWASRGQLMSVQNSKLIPGSDTACAELIPFHQAYLIKPDLSSVILGQRKSKSGFLINIVKKGSLSLLVKRERDALYLSENAPLDQMAERLMDGRMTLQQRRLLQTRGAIIETGEPATSTTERIELVILPRGVLLRPLEEKPVGQG